MTHLLILALLSSVQATELQVRAPLHATRDINHGFGVAGWMIEPNILDNDRQLWSVIGPRYQTDKWSIEVMGGGMLQSENPFPIFDIRASWKATNWLHFWGETAYANGFYYFAQADTPVWIGKVGIEVEQNQFGPHVIVPFGDHFTLVTTYHITNDTLRAYMVLNF